jgi:chromosome partitioning protein
MKTIVFANQKGGVGKSATACLFAHYLAQQGQRVLVIDFDHQGNLSKALQSSGRVDLAGISASQVLDSPQPEVGPGVFVLVAADSTAPHCSAWSASPSAITSSRGMCAAS